MVMRNAMFRQMVSVNGWYDNEECNVPTNGVRIPLGTW
jgi:hypothetical protein